MKFHIPQQNPAVLVYALGRTKARMRLHVIRTQLVPFACAVALNSRRDIPESPHDKPRVFGEENLFLLLFFPQFQMAYIKKFEDVHTSAG